MHQVVTTWNTSHSVPGLRVPALTLSRSISLYWTTYSSTFGPKLELQRARPAQGQTSRVSDIDILTIVMCARVFSLLCESPMGWGVAKAKRRTFSCPRMLSSRDRSPLRLEPWHTRPRDAVSARRDEGERIERVTGRTCTLHAARKPVARLGRMYAGKHG
jgi:hypothetical protein